MKWILLPASLLAALAPIANAQRLGANFGDPEEYRDIPLAVQKDRGVLPERIDLSSDFPRPGDQGNQSSCVGWAVAYALKGYLEKKERAWPGNSRTQLFSPAYIYNQINGGVDEGSSIADALDLVLTKGVATLEDFPYTDTNFTRMPGPELIEDSKEFAIASYRRLDASPDALVSLTSLAKNHLASGFPVLIGMQVGKQFMSHSGGGIYKATGTGNDEGGHAMCTVGYDDSRQAFKVINSWGTGWGEGGFGWVDYDTFNEKVGRAFVVQDIVIYEPNTPPSVTPPPAPIAPTADDFDPVTPQSPWIFPNSSISRIQPSELRVRSAEQLWRARNEIYARHGYIFSSDRGKAFTRLLGSAYTPRSGDSDAIEAQFNKTELYNIDLIRSFEHNRPNPVTPVSADRWVFPDSSARRLSDLEVSRLSKDQLWRARNEIFARNGYIFSTDKGKAFARSMGHLYEPRTSDMTAIYESFNRFEQHNVQIIKRYE